PAGGVVVEIACRRHPAQPLAPVALIDAGALRELAARGRAVAGQRLEEAQPVADGRQQDGVRPAGVAEHPADEGLRPRLVEGTAARAGVRLRARPHDTAPFSHRRRRARPDGVRLPASQSRYGLTAILMTPSRCSATTRYASAM